MTWKPGELLYTLHCERQWRTHGYTPWTPKVTLSDCLNIEAEIVRLHPHTHMLRDVQPRLLDLALDSLNIIENRA